MTVLVENRDYRNGRFAGSEIYGVRKPMYQTPPDILIDNGELEGASGDSLEELVELRCEFLAQPGPATLIPGRRLFNVELGRRANNEAPRHRSGERSRSLRRTSSRTSSHGLPSWGSAR